MKKYMITGGFIIVIMALLILALRWKAEHEKVIVLDPGHGGQYPGFEMNGLVEKDIVLNISHYIKEDLEKKGYKVYMTRDTDKECDSKGYIEDLSCRPKLGRSVNADLFLSIHANGFSQNPSVRGIEAFYFTLFRDKKAAEIIAAALSQETGLPLRFVKFGNYKVLRESLVPSALVEVGYLTNREDAKLLSADAFQKKTADGIIKGIEAFTK
ncbi:N-acetylmuramoyl-L-alanine amidase family protein [Ectobacillus panaciterrae]|uniref:N-acetylmuramoyl-L-alanine amidase family protein n=1 Tax=Ectobacillus panaciterrae TaxID=363872 RepID=UPI0003F8A044|nr:N-acetylmuramoyl-L-alanine amidase [Ectobacillus panaciterrae]